MQLIEQTILDYIVKPDKLETKLSHIIGFNIVKNKLSPTSIKCVTTILEQEKDAVDYFTVHPYTRLGCDNTNYDRQNDSLYQSPNQFRYLTYTD
jgi:hypothetical protein